MNIQKVYLSYLLPNNFSKILNYDSCYFRNHHRVPHFQRNYQNNMLYILQCQSNPMIKLRTDKILRDLEIPKAVNK